MCAFFFLGLSTKMSLPELSNVKQSEVLDNRLLDTIDEVVQRFPSETGEPSINWHVDLAPYWDDVSKSQRGANLTAFLKSIRPYAYAAALLPQFLPRLGVALRSA